ncbi:MAG: class I SAM-dependent methyltransferase [Candidatus Kuenenia sp.]|nr:class I SAM-dependent methyltransferase [Candidatus Kuenenia hertensis]
MLNKNKLPYFIGVFFFLINVRFCTSVLFASEQNKLFWDKRYRTEEYIFGKEPVAFLKEHISLLPKGKALDLATGEGRNAVFLAENGFEVDCCDVSEIAIEKAKNLAKQNNVRINAFVADLEVYKLPKNSYDVISCFYYLQRDIIPQIKDALKTGGMIIYETFTIENLERGFGGPKNRDYLLRPNELLECFREFKIIYYRELVVDNKKAIASLIAEK